MNNNNHPRFRKSLLSLAVVLPTVALAAPLEEVIVTAQKRVESLQDVPIAVSAISGEKLLDNGITDLEELTQYMPNVNINQGQAQPNLFIRGVGSGTNVGFEQSVGLYVDGIYSGRGALARVPMTLDLQRVEVLKGPQGTLFGKNTIGGAINVTTNKPSFDNEGMVDALYSPDANQQMYTLVLNGGLTDKIAGRLALRYEAMDGWWDNQLLKDQGPDTEDWYGRGSFLFDATENLEVIAKYEHGDFKTDNPPTVVYHSDQPLNFRGENVFPIVDDQDRAAYDYPESYKNTTNVGAVTVNWDMAFATLTSISAYSGYHLNRAEDSDRAAIAAVSRTQEEDFDQWSQELRLVSPGGETLDWIAGAYYEYSNLKVHRVNEVLDFGLAGPLAVVPLLNLPGTTPVPTNFDQDTDSYATFGQLTYRLTDTVRVTGGLRYTYEKKTLDSVVDNQGGVRGLALGLPEVIIRANPATHVIISDLRSHDWQGLDQDDSKWTWSVNTQWDATDEAMLYASVSTGFKAGGYDETYSSEGSTLRLSDNIFTGEPNGQVIPGADPSVLEYKPETVVAYEVGAKMTLLDGAAELNIAIFRSDYDDLQTSSLEGDVFVVGNAGEARTEGVEVDARWALTDNLTVGGSVAWLDAHYEDFTGATCTIPQVTDPANYPGCLDENGDNIVNANDPGGQDLGGEDLIFSPEWSANLNVQYIYPLGNGLELSAGVDMNYSDDYYSALDLDPYTKHDDYTLWDARIGLSGDNDTWTVAVIGRNLTDETTWVWKNDIAPTASFSYFAVPQQGRSVAVQGRYRF